MSRREKLDGGWLDFSVACMASKQASPTGNLLRRSRLFSLPPPIRKRQTPDSSNKTSARSTPYPTYAAIETPPASLHRGDWGLKRPLPSKSFRSTSTPTIRVSQVDSNAHIVDFEPASDHVQTLRKWQEMNVPVVKESTSMTRPRSAFEDDEDRRVTTPSRPYGGASLSTRWRYHGPFLAGMEQGEFDAYVRDTVKRRRKEFLRYLWTNVLQTYRAEREREAGEAGRDVEEEVPLSQQAFVAALIRLRQGRQELQDYIRTFFDLSDDLLFLRRNDEPISKGPPTTHPSAGLSYLRTTAVVPNHPTFGPTLRGPPVPARALDEFFSESAKGFGTIGIGGIVTTGDASLPGSRDTTNARYWGGSKVSVHPTRATIDPSGRIELELSQVQADERSLWGDVAYMNPLEKWSSKEERKKQSK